MAARLIATAAAALIMATATAQAWPRVCAQPGLALVFDVSFSAAHENSIVIQNAQSGAWLRSFNNFVGRGAGGEWNQGAGRWQTPVHNGAACYFIVSQHKPGPANPGLPWVDSPWRIFGSKVGFEDANDNDFNDVSVTVGYSGAPRIFPN